MGALSLVTTLALLQAPAPSASAPPRCVDGGDLIRSLGPSPFLPASRVLVGGRHRKPRGSDPQLRWPTSPSCGKPMRSPTPPFARADEARAPLFPQVTGSATYQRATSNFVPRPGSVPNTVTSATRSNFDTFDYWNFGITREPAHLRLRADSFTVARGTSDGRGAARERARHPAADAAQRAHRVLRGARPEGIARRRARHAEEPRAPPRANPRVRRDRHPPRDRSGASSQRRRNRQGAGHQRRERLRDRQSTAQLGHGGGAIDRVRRRRRYVSRRRRRRSTDRTAGAVRVGDAPRARRLRQAATGERAAGELCAKPPTVPSSARRPVSPRLAPRSTTCVGIGTPK